MKLALILYCAFAYGFEFNNALNISVDDEIYKEFNNPNIVSAVLLVVFLLGPIVMPLNWLINTIKFMKEK